MNAIENIEKDLEGLHLENPMMVFPINHLGDGLFEIAPGINRTIADRGAAYMNTRIRNRKGRFDEKTLKRFSWVSFTSRVKKAKMAALKGNASLANTHWNSLASHMNECMAALKSVGVDKPVYAVCVNGELRGITTKNFDFFDNKLIIEQIRENALGDSITSWHIDQEAFDVCFKVKSKVGNDGTLISVCLTNGHAGFDALRLDTRVNNGKYAYVVPKSFFEKGDEETSEKPFVQRNRHMGWIEQVFGSLVELLERVGELNFNESLKAMTALQFIVEIHKSVSADVLSEKRTAEIMTWTSGNAGKQLKTGFDVFADICNWAGTRGYGAAVDKILNPTLDRIFENMKGN